MLHVRSICREDYLPLILEVHYAKRCPSITWAFGLFLDECLLGICTFGTPSSSPLRRGVCGPEYAKDVVELNRLCLHKNEKNYASFLVAKSLKLLPKPKIVVSYADTEQKHVGVVYQAANFIYTGLSAKRTDWKVRGLEHLHGQTIADKFRGVKDRGKHIREFYGEDFYLEQRPRKHRYVYFIGSKGERRKMLKSLRYPTYEYPRSGDRGCTSGTPT